MYLEGMIVPLHVTIVLILKSFDMISPCLSTVFSPSLDYYCLK